MSETQQPERSQTIKVIQPAESEEQVVRVTDPDANADEITSAMTGCVVHLCGCK